MSDSPPPLKGKPNRPASEFIPAPPAPDSTVGISFKVADFHYHGNGIITLHVPAAELSEADRALFRELLPHTIDKFYDLLAKENVLSSMFEGNVKSPPKHERCVNRTGIIYDN